MDENIKGYIITADPSSLKNIVYDEVWQITRSGPDITGAIRVRDLSPSPELFNLYYKEWKNKNPEDWWHFYVQKFNKELNTEEKVNALRKLYLKVKAGKVIALICFCSDSRYCHRTLVGEYLIKYGVRVEEYKKAEKSPSEYVQLALF